LNEQGSAAQESQGLITSKMCSQIDEPDGAEQLLKKIGAALSAANNLGIATGEI